MSQVDLRSTTANIGSYEHIAKVKQPTRAVRYQDEVFTPPYITRTPAESGESIPIKFSKSPTPSLTSLPILKRSLENNDQTIVRYARSPCDQCGHHNIPIMTHPISPLAKSQNNLELIEISNGRTTLTPVAPISHNIIATSPTQPMMHRDSSFSLAPTLQISRRPSLLLQDILAKRPSIFITRRDPNGNYSPRNNKNLGSLHGTANGSSVTINAPGGGHDDTGAKSFQAKQSKTKNRRQGNDAISAALSLTYCKMLVLLGVCLPITEVISGQIPNYVYQSFYVYLYSGSIIFVIFVYITAYRNRSLFNALKDFHERNNNVHLKHNISHFGSFYLRVGAIAFAIGTMVYSGLEFGQYFELNGNAGCRNIFVAITPICRMILCIFQIQFIFLNTTYLDMARHKVTSRFGLMHMVATNLCEWLYVLVEETKHEIFHIGLHEDEIEPLPTVSNGTVNWSATNDSLHSQHAGIAAVTHNHNLSVIGSGTIGNILKNISTTVLPTLTTATVAPPSSASAVIHTGCTRTNIMGHLVQEVSPFLFPCTIEYSLICAVILYEMWKTVRSIPDIDRTRKSSMKPIIQKPAHHFSVDCSQSHKGLFFGILIIVMTIISMIMYFVLYLQPGYELVATQEVTLWETTMYFLCGSAIVTGIILMRDLKYVQIPNEDHHSMHLDNMLLIVAQTGVYLYGMFSILGSYFSQWDTVPDRIEGIIGEVFGLAETMLQTMFILHASRRRCKGAKQAKRKPGREIITFLLVANIAIWFVNTLIKGRAVFRATHLEFFGIWGWTIITHISMPLAIFYRFHSTICLFEVWKITYKSKSH